MDFSTPRLSCIAIVDFSQDIRFLYVTESLTELLGWEPREMIGRPGAELVHPDEFSQVRELHYDTIRQDKAAVLAYLRLKHKDPLKGYLLCVISRTVVHNVLVGSISPATPGAKALQNASTAQEVVVVTPSAKDFEFRRWGDPSPMPPSPHSPASWEIAGNDRPDYQRRGGVFTFNPLPFQSSRSALILDRFSIHCTIQYCSNDLLVEPTTVMGRSFFDFVAQRSDEQVRQWIDLIKAWGVNERGQPSDGGFGFGKFILLPRGRDSRGEWAPEASTSKRRDMLAASSRSQLQSGRSSRSRQHTLTVQAEIPVDAIFSAHSDGILVILRATSLSVSSV